VHTKEREKAILLGEKFSFFPFTSGDDIEKSRQKQHEVLKEVSIEINIHRK
jgi:hypothetical protein